MSKRITLEMAQFRLATVRTKLNAGLGDGRGDDSRKMYARVDGANGQQRFLELTADNFQIDDDGLLILDFSEKDAQLKDRVRSEMTEAQRKAMELYKPPFKFMHGYIFDADHNMVSDNGDLEDQAAGVARIRGWGRLSYMENPEQLQDAAGELFALALTRLWEEFQPEAAE